MEIKAITDPSLSQIRNFARKDTILPLCSRR